MRQSTITFSSIAVAAVLSALLVAGILFSRAASVAVEEANDRQTALLSLADQVRASSAGLTDDVRHFALTGDDRYLDSYWTEVDETQSQAAAVAELEALGVAADDLALVDESSANSAQLVDTETRAMRLLLEADGVAPSAMPSAIAGHDLSAADADLSSEEQRALAQTILFDEAYRGEVDRIMGPLDEFAERLSSETAAAIDAASARSNLANLLLIGLGILIPAGIAALLWVVHVQMARPVSSYVEALAAREAADGSRLHPRGTVELRSLADALNDEFERSESLLSDIQESARRTSGEASNLSAASQQVSQNVATVATAIEEMNASVREIAQSATDASQVAEDAVLEADSTNVSVQQLGTSSQEIGQVVGAITAIAEQTNLLALNATIEAARAGDAGKGFAVVANEVKELAHQTATATEDITARIGAIQQETETAVAGIGRIAEVIRQISDHQQTISSAVDEQTATTNEIARNVNEAATGVNDVAAGAQAVADIAGGSSTERAPEEGLRHASTDLHQPTEFERELAPA